MFSNILTATDLSRDSDGLIRCVTGLHSMGCRRVHLVYGLEIENIGSLRADIERLIHDELSRQKEVLESGGIETICHVVMSPLASEIRRLAEENSCSLLVVGSRVHSLLGEMIFGGIAAAVLTHARYPLLMIRQHLDKDGKPDCLCWPCRPLEHVLYPTDFSENAEHVFKYLEEFVKETSPARLTLMHIQDKQRIEPHLKARLDDFNLIDRKRLESLRERLPADARFRVDIELLYGHPAREIAAYCRRESVSLVVMGSQGRGHAAEFFLGSVSHNVARHAPVPVLLIPVR